MPKVAWPITADNEHAQGTTAPSLYGKSNQPGHILHEAIAYALPDGGNEIIIGGLVDTVLGKDIIPLSNRDAGYLLDHAWLVTEFLSDMMKYNNLKETVVSLSAYINPHQVATMAGLLYPDHARDIIDGFIRTRKLNILQVHTLLLNVGVSPDALVEPSTLIKNPSPIAQLSNEGPSQAVHQQTHGDVSTAALNN
jgi:hypothetical protein